MGLSYAWKQLVSGNPEDAFNGLFTSDDALSTSQAVNDAQSKLIAQQQAKGLISSDQAQQDYSLMAPNTDSSSYWTQAGADPYSTFGTAVEQNAASIGQFGSKAINKIAGLGFKIIPWQVYILIFILVLIWAYPLWRPFAAALSQGGKK